MTLPTSASWGPVGRPLRVPYEAPQGRRVNALGAHFTHGPAAGEFAFVTLACLPQSRAKQPPSLAAQAEKHGLTPEEVGRLDAEVFLGFLWTVAGRPSEAPESWRRERPLHYVLDNYTVHRCERVQQEEAAMRAAGIHLFFLPPYCPELSRIEPDWRDVKYQGLPVRSHAQLGALKAAVDEALACKAIELRKAKSRTAQLLPITP